MCYGAFRAAMGRGPYDYLTLPLIFLLGGIFIVENGKQKGIYFKVSDKERDLIEQKMALAGVRNMSGYIRKMAIDGYIIQLDYTAVKEQTAEIQKVGVNVNQIAKRVNSTGNAYKEDLEEIKGALEKIWQLQRYTLSKLR